MSRSSNDVLLLDYLDGRLAGEDAGRVERKLRNNTELRSEFDEISYAKSVLLGFKDVHDAVLAHPVPPFSGVHKPASVLSWLAAAAAGIIVVGLVVASSLGWFDKSGGGILPGEDGDYSAPEENGTPLPDAEALIVALKSDDEETRLKAYAAIKGTREKIAERLVRILEAAKDPTDVVKDEIYHNTGSATARAISLAGALELEDERLIAALYKKLEYKIDLRVTTWGENKWLVYTAAASLIKIGRPARKGAYDILAGESGELRRELAFWIVLEIDGAPLARFVVAERLKEPGIGDDVRANLEIALAAFEAQIEEHGIHRRAWE